MKNTIFILLILIVFSCKKEGIDSLPDCESSKPVFTALPIDEEMIANFITLVLCARNNYTFIFFNR